MVKNGKNIHQDFTSELQKKGEDNNFIYQQVKDRSFGSGLGSPVSDGFVVNNDKGSTICLRKEIEGTEDKLGHSSSDYGRAKELERQYLQEVPPKKEDCRII